MSDEQGGDMGLEHAKATGTRKEADHKTEVESGAGGVGGAGGGPATADELHRWIRDELGVYVPRESLVGGHAAPFEYLKHVFFEGALTPDEPLDCVVWASRGGGKTFLGAVATVLDLVFKPGIEIRILGGSLDQSKRMHAHLLRLFATQTLAEMIDGRATERRLRLTNGSSVELLAQSQASVRGTRVQKLRCDEVELFDPEVWEAAQLVTRSKDCGGIMVHGSIECLSTMHLPHGLMHRLVHSPDEARRTVFRWSVIDVLERCGQDRDCERCSLQPECGGLAKARPIGSCGHVSIDDAIRMKHRVGSAMWASEMLCDRPRRTDAVLPEFDPAVHVVDDANVLMQRVRDERDDILWVAGMDFGYRSPTVVVFAAVLAGEDGTELLVVVDEHAASGLVLDRHVEAIKASPWPAPAWFGVDPAGRQRNDQTGQSNIDALRAAGFDVRSRPSRLVEGIDMVRARLSPADGSTPRLYIHRRCATLIESLERYHYPPGRPDCIEPAKDGADHAVDALRYLVLNLDRPGRCTAGNYLNAR